MTMDVDNTASPDGASPAPKPSRRHLTPEEYETVAFFSALFARIAFFAFMGVQCAYS